MSSMSGLGRRTSLAGLVDELDDRLDPPPIIIIDPPSVRRQTGPKWAGIAMLATLIVGALWFLVSHANAGCTYSESICAIEDLDIDALMVTAPRARLFELLPHIDELDPDDRFTLGDVLEWERFNSVDPDSLFSPDELERILGQLE